MDFSGGVDSVKVTTIASEANPNGLARNQLAWLTNGETRDGGINTRTGWLNRVRIADGTKWFQGGGIYQYDEGFPYLMMLIGGDVYKQLLEEPYTLTNISAAQGPGLSMPDGELYAYFCQAERYMVIQAGDYATLPLFWDGTTLTRSRGITGDSNPLSPTRNQIPAAGPMDYYMGRLWYAGVPTRRHYCAGDVVQGTSGTAPNYFLDAVLCVTENPLAVGGDGFVVPTNAGNIRALKHTSNQDSTLGVSDLFIFTRNSVYSLTVPVSRASWILAGNGTGATTNPVQKIIVTNGGAVNDRTIVAVNQDLFYQCLDPSIRSLAVAIRYQQQWGNKSLSSNEDRLLKFTDRELMKWCSGIEFNNRLLQSALPKRVGCGIVSPALLPMDFDPITSLGSDKPPIWQGDWEGLDFLQLFKVDYNGRPRAFGTIASRLDGSIQLWELTDYSRFETDDRRNTMIIETPSFAWNRETVLKELDAMELWVDKIYGTVNFKVEYRPDSDPCWYKWWEWQRCVARNSAEDVENPVSYPLTEYREGYRTADSLGRPYQVCQSNMGRPSSIGYQFQLRFTIKGWCRIRAFVLHANIRAEHPYQNLVCYHAFTESDAAL
jgi:hypothetical protein